MKNGPYDDLPDERRDILRSLFDASFGRLAAAPGTIAKWIHDFVTINRLIGK
jgi:hypothetical protein